MRKNIRKIHSTNNTTEKNRKRTGLAEAIVAAAVCLAIFLLVIIARLFAPAEEIPELTIESLTSETAAEELLSSEITLPISLAENLLLTGLYAADALFPEDGSNTPGENLLCAVVRNDSKQTLEYMTFTLTCGEEAYEFSVTTLPPSTEVYAFEKNAAKAPERITELTAECPIRLFFAEEPTRMEEQLEFTVNDGSIEVKNITDTPTDQEIQVYYKNTENLAYFGGITYFLRVPAGLAPGETYNAYAANASKARTEVMFVKYGN